MRTEYSSPFDHSLVAVIFGSIAFTALIVTSIYLAGMQFEYPLDDTYIHLAMAEQLANGGYGVNAGEYAAASSSPLFSVLLLPFVGEPFHRYLPLILNGFGLFLACVIWGRILWQSGWGNTFLAFTLAAIGPVLLNFMGLAFVGMEHSLHLAASLAIVSGMVTVVSENKVGWLLFFGILLAPLLRFEGVALAGMAALITMLNGRYFIGFFLGLLATLPLAGFAYWLTTLGLDPLPSSVSAKLAMPGGTASTFEAFIYEKRLLLMSDKRAQVLGALIVVAFLMLLVKSLRERSRILLLFAIICAGLAHLAFGRFGWMDRYEMYIIASMTAALLAVTAGNLRLQLLPIAVMFFAAWVYLPNVLTKYPTAPGAVIHQQAQMSRFVKEYYQAPVAVNDLGYVAWNNPNYVLDLWGLANHEARQARLHGTDQKWVGKLTDKHDAKLAMIYADWFPNQLDDDWQLLGGMTLQVSKGYLASETVSFFQTGPQDTATVIAQLKEWQKGLPKGVTFEFADGVAE